MSLEFSVLLEQVIFTDLLQTNRMQKQKVAIMCLMISSWARLQKFEKRLLISSCLVRLCIHPSASKNSASTGQIFVKFY